MKELYLFIVIFIGLMLPGCANVKNSDQPVQKIASTKQQSSNHPTHLSMNSSSDDLIAPEMIKVYPSGVKPHHRYKVIGRETVSKYNHVGIKRQEALIHDAFRTKAASLGGDAVINITRDDKKVTAEIVAFENPKMG